MVSLKELKTTAIAPLLVTVGLGLCALFVSKEFGYFYTTAKWLVIVFSFLALSLHIFTQELSFSLPSSKRIQFTFLALALFTAYSAFGSNLGERAGGFSAILLWVGLIFSIATLATHKKNSAFLEKVIHFQMPVIFFAFIYFLISELLFHKEIKPFFGNPNVASNYIALSLIQIFYFIFTTDKKAYKIAGGLFSVIGILLLYLFKARGAMLGFGVGGLYTALHVFDFVTDKKQLQKKFKSYRPFVYGLAFIVCLILGYAQYLKGTRTLHNRYSFWINTICMMKDHPMGVGPGSFEYVFQQYNGRCFPSLEIGEGISIRNPHNSFLEFFAEIGVLGGITVLLLLFLLFYELSCIPKDKFLLERRWIVSSSLVLLVISLFEFPQDTPFTFFYLALVAGVLISILPNSKNKYSSQMRALHLAFALIITFVYTMKAYSDHITLKPGETPEQSYKLACTIDRENWRACTWLGLSYLNKNDFESADKIINLMSDKFEGHHSLMHLRGTYALKKGDMRGACDQFKQYHSLFGFKSSKKEFIDKNCL